MGMETEPKSTISISQAIVLSVLGTLVVLGGLFLAFEAKFQRYLVDTLEPIVSTKIPTPAEPETFEARVVSAIAKVNPAVVSVIVTKEVPVYEQVFETVNPWGVFGGFMVPRIIENGTEERQVGGGSGFIVSHDGLVVTNRHVVDDDEARYTVVLSDGSFYNAEVVDRDPQLDIAVLRIVELPQKQLPVAEFGDSQNLQLGQTVIAIGNALAEFQNSVSLGIVSGLGRSIVASDTMGNSEQLNQVIQTDAAINPGNSGGPLLNLEGEVVGVNVATSRGADNIGFALPSQIVRQVVDSVRAYNEIVRPFLGVRYVMVNDGLSEEFDLPVNYGALLVVGGEQETAVEPDSPAEAVGLQAGDVILSIDGISLRNNDLATELRNKQPNQDITLEVQRGDMVEEIIVTLKRAS
jgi:serine protease Do